MSIESLTRGITNGLKFTSRSYLRNNALALDNGMILLDEPATNYLFDILSDKDMPASEKIGFWAGILIKTPKETYHILKEAYAGFRSCITKNI